MLSIAKQFQDIRRARRMIWIVREACLVQRHTVDAIFAIDDRPATRRILRNKQRAAKIKGPHDRSKLCENRPAHRRIGLFVDEIE